MRKCTKCSSKFETKKDFHKLCDKCFTKQFKSFYKCKTCGKKVKPTSDRLICCGYDEPLKVRGTRITNLPQVGTGEIYHNRGVLTYIDDGNGNEWDQEFQDCDGDFWE